MTKTSAHHPRLFLMSTSGCHLCDLAKEKLALLEQPYEEVDIIEDQALVEAYGDKIPILIVEQAEQALFWPFDEYQIEEYKKYHGIS